MISYMHPDLYDELVAARQRIARLQADCDIIRDELRVERAARNKAVTVAGRAFLDRDSHILSIRCKIDQAVLRHAHNTREAFSLIVARWFDELWSAYRASEIPTPEAPDAPR